MHQKTLRIRVFLIVLFIVFLLAGCSGQEANAASEAQPAEKRVTTEKVKRQSRMHQRERVKRSMNFFSRKHPEAQFMKMILFLSTPRTFPRDILWSDIPVMPIKYGCRSRRPTGTVYNYTMFAGLL